MTSPQGQDQVSASLLGCPFCGGVAYFRDAEAWSDGPAWDVACDSCSAIIPCCEGDKADALAIWNRRTPPPAVSEVREAVITIISDALNCDMPEPWDIAVHAADKILALPLPRMEGGISPSQSQPSGDASALPADPWTQWNGGENPAPGKVVEWRNRCGGSHTCRADDLAGWSHPHYGGPDLDIIAYRIIPHSDGEEG